MHIRTAEDYARALERLEKLKDAGETSSTSAELAELEAAVEQYSLEKPAGKQGRPPHEAPFVGDEGDRED